MTGLNMRAEFLIGCPLTEMWACMMHRGEAVSEEVFIEEEVATDV